MEEDSDISAAQLAAICNKGQYARSISLALSANTSEDLLHSTSAEQVDGSSASGQDAVHRPTSCKEVEELEDAARREGGTKKDDGDEEDIENATEDDSSTEGSSPKSDDCDAMSEPPLPQAAASHHRRRTKLQRQRLRELQVEFLAPFMRDSDSEEELAAMGTVEGEDRPQRVPTLMELCMQRGISKAGSLPPGLRPMLSHHRSKARLAALQLRWLGHNFGLLEKQIKWHVVEVLQPHGVKTPQLRRDARSLWRTDWWTGGTEPHPEQAQWILPVGGQTFNAVDWKIAALAHYLNLMLPHQYTEPRSDKSKSEDEQGRRGDRDVQQAKRHLRKRYPKLVKYCFDHAMAYVWWARGRCTQAQEAFMKAIKGYPADTNPSSQSVHRHRAIGLAEIGRLLTTFDRPDSAGQFYREAIEVTASNVHPYEVSKLILQSLALTASAYDQGLMDQHSAIQAARLWTATVQQAQSIKDVPPAVGLGYLQWNDPRNDPHKERGSRDAVLAAVESLVHCHVGHLMDPVNRDLPCSAYGNREWLSEAASYLEKLMDERCAFVGLYLSFILAMLNEGIAAENAYHFCLRSYRTYPGEVARTLSMGNVKPHPWWLFSEWIKARTTAVRRVISYPLRVLPLVWRRGLGHPSYCHDRSTDVSIEQVADIQGVTLDLHLTPKGHLTGAMVQNLPPLRTVCLDPYNGQLHFGDSCCDDKLQKWDNYDQHYLHQTTHHEKTPKHRFNCNSSLPQPNVIYSDPETSTTVSLLIPGISKYYEAEASTNATLVSKSTRCARTVENIKCIHREMRPNISAIYQSSGKSVKIDIVELVLQEQKKFILGELSKMNDYGGALIKQAEGLVDYGIKQRYEITLSSIFTFIQQKLEESQKPSRPHQQQSASDKTDFARYFDDQNFAGQKTQKVLEMLLKNVLYVGKATVVLLLHVQKYDAFVFLDCTSPSSFSQPVVRANLQGLQFRHQTSVNGWTLPDNSLCWKTQDPTASILLAFSAQVGYSLDEMHLFDERGNILCYEELGDFSKWNEQRVFATCHGHKIIGTNKDQTRITVCDLQTGVDCWSVELPQILKVVIAHNTVYISTTQGPHALDINTLEPLVTLQLKPSRYILPSNEEGRLLDQSDASAKHFELFCPHEIMITSDGAVQYYRAFLAVENHVLLLQRRKIEEEQLLEEEQPPDVLEILDIMIPGKPMELCYISQQDGFVVSATIFSNKSDPYYRENLYWFDMSGNIIGIHPFIGGGHHSFLPVYLGAKDGGKSEGRENELYLYFADGLGALCCIKLDMFY